MAVTILQVVKGVQRHLRSECENLAPLDSGRSISDHGPIKQIECL